MRKGRICLNWRLVRMPDSVRDYVMSCAHSGMFEVTNCDFIEIMPVWTIWAK